MNNKISTFVVELLVIILVGCVGENSFAGTVRVNVNSYDVMIIPQDNGVQEAIQTKIRVYPSRDWWGQFAIFSNTASMEMLLIHAKDTNPQYIQNWEIINNDVNAPCINGQWCLRIVFRGPIDPVVDQKKYSMTSDWRVPAEDYKRWAQKQNWWRSHEKIASGQLGHIINCATNSYVYYQLNMEDIFPIFGSKRVGCFMSQYRASAFDVNYPDYTCLALANCTNWLKNIRDTGNGFGLPYINGALWDTTHVGYAASNMCLDSGGLPTIYSGNLRYVDPLLLSWPSTLFAAFDSLNDVNGVNSEGVYLDVIGAVAKVCHYSGVPSYSAWITGTKDVFTQFTLSIVMAEGVPEIYLPYVDIVYMYPPNTDKLSTIGMYGYVYGDVPGLHIVGMSTKATDTVNTCYTHQWRARNIFKQSAMMVSGGFVCDMAIQNDPALAGFYKGWNNNAVFAP